MVAILLMNGFKVKQAECLVCLLFISKIKLEIDYRVPIRLFDHSPYNRVKTMKLIKHEKYVYISIGTL